MRVHAGFFFPTITNFRNFRSSSNVSTPPPPPSNGILQVSQPQARDDSGGVGLTCHVRAVFFPCNHQISFVLQCLHYRRHDLQTESFKFPTTSRNDLGLTSRVHVVFTSLARMRRIHTHAPPRTVFTCRHALAALHSRGPTSRRALHGLYMHTCALCAHQAPSYTHHVAHTRRYVHNQFAPRTRSPHQFVRRTYLSPPGLSRTHARTHRQMHARHPASLSRTHACTHTHIHARHPERRTIPPHNSAR